jgi:hypothetical protein
MAKQSMRTYYILGALILGIVLLYLYTNNIEPFASTSRIYVYIPQSGPAKMVSSSNPNISLDSITANKLKLKFKTPMTLKDYTMEAYKKTTPSCTTNCWTKVSITGTPIDIQNTTETKSISANGKLNKAQKSEKTISFTNFTKGYLPLLEHNENKLPNKANIRIDLVL